MLPVFLSVCRRHCTCMILIQLHLSFISRTQSIFCAGRPVEIRRKPRNMNNKYTADQAIARESN